MHPSFELKLLIIGESATTVGLLALLIILWLIAKETIVQTNTILIHVSLLKTLFETDNSDYHSPPLSHLRIKCHREKLGWSGF